MNTDKVNRYFPLFILPVCHEMMAFFICFMLLLLVAVAFVFCYISILDLCMCGCVNVFISMYLYVCVCVFCVILILTLTYLLFINIRLRSFFTSIPPHMYFICSLSLFHFFLFFLCYEQRIRIGRNENVDCESISHSVRGVRIEKTK